MKYYVFNVGNINNMYHIQLRKNQLEKYKIPYTFLFIGKRSSDYEVDVSHDLFSEDPKYFDVVLKDFDKKDFDFVIKVDLSRFINFRVLERILKKFPKDGIYEDETFSIFGGNLKGDIDTSEFLVYCDDRKYVELVKKVDNISQEEISIIKYRPRLNLNNKKRKIPYIFFQTSETSLLHYTLSEQIKDCVKRNSNYEYHFFDDTDSRNFIAENFPLDVLNTFDNLIPGAYKADLFRYCYLFINGGFYVDINKTLEVTLDELIDYNYDYDFISVIDRYNDKDKQFGIYQAIIASSPNSELMKVCIEKIVYNVKNNFYGINALHPTGPILLGSEFQKIYGFKTNQPGIYSNYNVVIKFLKNSENGNYTFDHRNKVITNTNQYVKTIQNKLWKKNTAKDHYSVMYSNRKIYRNQVIYESHLKYFLIFYLIAIMTFFAIYIRLRK